jgi:hypothetical protein
MGCAAFAQTGVFHHLPQAIAVGACAFLLSAVQRVLRARAKEGRAQREARAEPLDVPEVIQIGAQDIAPAFGDDVFERAEIERCADGLLGKPGQERADGIRWGLCSACRCPMPKDLVATIIRYRPSMNASCVAWRTAGCSCP